MDAFFVPSARSVQCMAIGNNNLPADLTTAVGPDSQPYFAGQRAASAGFVTSFDNPPGGSSKSAWPNCIWQTNGSLSLAEHGRTPATCTPRWWPTTAPRKSSALNLGWKVDESPGSPVGHRGD
jgi:hypothetical protein